MKNHLVYIIQFFFFCFANVEKESIKMDFTFSDR